MNPFTSDKGQMRVSQQQVLDFARWTGDCNPIHVDPIAAKESAFGGTICHGMLVLIESLAKWDIDLVSFPEPLSQLSVQFRGEVRPDKLYSNCFEVDSKGIAGKVSQANSLQMDLACRWGGQNPVPAFDWMQSAMQSGMRSGSGDQPTYWTPDAFQSGLVTLGLHAFGEHQVSSDSRLNLLQEQVLGLCSFIVGMKVPGLASLFTKLSVDFFSETAATQELLYRLTLLSFDENFRILEMQLDVASPDLVPVASCRIECYVRFANQLTAGSTYADVLGKSVRENDVGKLAVICGASRGLGAEIAIGLAAANFHTVLVSRNRSSVTDAICSDIQTFGGSAEVILGDIGDSVFCSSLANSLREKGQRLDLLVLNACEPPVHGILTASEVEKSLGYVTRNVRLFLSPLQSLLPLVAEANGCVVGVSSSFVEETPSGFSDYVSVKCALESSLRVSSKEHTNTRFLIARPPKLQTTWNDTPTASLGAIPVRDASLAVIKQVLQLTDEPRQILRSNLEILSDFPKQNWPKRTTGPSDLSVSIVANFTLDPIKQVFDAWSDLLEKRIDLSIAPYNQILQELLNPASGVSQSKHGSTVLLRVGDWIKELPDSRRADSNDVDGFLLESADEFIRAVRQHRTFAKGSTLVLVCPNDPADFPGQVSDEHLCEKLSEELATIPGVTLWFSKKHHQRYSVPESQIFDPLRNQIGHIPYSDEYFAFLATLIVRFFSRKISLPKKVVVLDCDNTLWGGVVGEVGASGITVNSAHRKLIAKLKELAEGGVLLCLASKNEPEDVWQVFEDREDFLLSKNEIVASKINWMPKSQNISELANELNLGLDSFVFIDDNPVECAEVRAGCPSVLTIQWPHDEALASTLVDHFWELDLVAVTKEDRERTRMYKEEFERQQVQKSASNFQDFIDSLQLVVEFKNVETEDVPRASQLTLRTNQFNLTTVRRNESEIQALAERGDCDVCTLTVHDRFGDYGVVGLFIGIVDPEDRIYEVDTFLLSCRVLGRGVEHKIVAEIARRALARECTHVRWKYRPTEKNRPARLFLEKTLGVDFGSNSNFEGTLVAADLLDLTYRVQDSDPDAPTSDAEPPKVASESFANLAKENRRREMQIEQTVRSYADYRGLAGLIGSDSAAVAQDPSEDDEDQHPVAATEAVEESVVRVFAEVLKRPSEIILQLDRLESLGCDSLQIVGITVALSKVIPNLPPTLLFEHRSVSEIVKQIQELRRSKQRAIAQKSNSASGSQSASQQLFHQDIAIVGMCVHTSAGRGCDALWNTLLHGQSKIVRVPRDREDFVGQLQSDTPYFAGMLPNVSSFDPEFFGVSPREAQYMDPQLRMLMESAWHAIEDAGGFRPNVHQSTGVFVGYMYQCYGRFANPIAARSGSVYRCWEGFSFANRISQFLGVSGPSLAIDTACSSSATALHFACESLKRGDCQNAIVAGVNAIVDPSRIVQLGNLGILTPSGNCVPFGEGADGTVIGEGTVCVFLRPLSDALRDGDRIYAVIKGTGVSVGAGSVGFTAPNPVAQSLAIRAALADSQVDPRTIGYVETHGTGTQLGDPIEVRGLEIAYCDPALWDADLECQAHTGIGSIKPNIGHLEAGAGLVGVVKAALQLHHKTLLPSITSDQPNPQIPFDKLPFKVQRDSQAWAPPQAMRKSSRSVEVLPRRAAVNSFGVGGSNAHIVLEEAPLREIPQKLTDRSAHLLTLQAPTLEGLKLQASSWASFLKEQKLEDLGDAFYSNIIGRKNFEYRLALQVDDPAHAAEKLLQWTNSETEVPWGNALWKKSNRIAFLCTGQGAQYPGMLAQFYKESPVFKDAVDQCADRIDAKLEQPIRKILFDQTLDANPLIHQTRYTQPAIFIAQYALFKLWESYGVEPDIVLGHSIGEIAAYCVTGGCSLDDALELVRARGDLMQRLSPGGGMTSVSTSAQGVEAIFAEARLNLSIAAYNGPNQTVISGSLDEIAKFVEHAQRAGIKTQALKVSHAFHSSLMEPMLDEFRTVVTKLGLGIPKMEFLSTVTAQPALKELASAEYWVEQVRKPVRFMQAMEAIAAKSVSHFIEIGPHPVLTTMARATDLPSTDESTRWLSSARRPQDTHSPLDWSVLLGSIGQLYVDGYPIDWKRAESTYSRQRVSVPGYEFSNRRIWLDEIDQMVLGQRSTLESIPQTELERSKKQLLYKVRWTKTQPAKPKSGSAIAQGASPQRWLILSVGNPSLGKGLEQQLQTSGYSTSLVSWVPSSQDWTLQDSDLEGIDRIVLAAGHEASPPSKAADFQERCESQIIAFSKALKLVQSRQSSESSATAAKRVFWLVTSGATMFENAPALAPLVAPLWGGAKVASIELPEYWGGAIDVSLEKDALDQAIDWAVNPTLEDQVVFLDRNVWIPRLDRLEYTTDSDQAAMGQSVLITGGLGAIGFRLAQYAVSQGAKELVLVGRSNRVSKEQTDQIDQWIGSGVEVLLVSADVSTSAGIDALNEALEGKKIETLIHTAGVDFLSPIADWTSEDVRRVTIAKIQGAWNLHQWSIDQPIKRFVMTSSIASVWGAPDRFLYACANAFLDSLGKWRASKNLPVTVLNFGPWADGGMADKSSLEEYKRVGMHGLVPDQTVAIVGELIKQGIPSAVVTDTHWERFVSVMTARRSRPFFDLVLIEPVDEASGLSVGTSSRRSTSGSESKDSWILHLASMSPDSRLGDLKSRIRKELAEVLKSQEDKLPYDRCLYRLGLDSITAVELSMRIKKGAGVSVGKWLVGEPSIDSLAVGLLGNLESKLLQVAEQKGTETRSAIPSAPWVKELEQKTTPEHKRSHLIGLFTRELERFIGKTSAEVKASTPMSGLGLDSLGAVDFATHLRKQLGLSSPPRLMQYATVSDWVESVLDKLSDRRPEVAVAVEDCVPSVQASEGIQVELYKASMRPEVIDFCRKGWPERSLKLLEDRWNWMFLDSAKRVGASPMIWLARSGGSIVGHMGAQFTRLKTSAGELTVPWFVDTMVLEQHRQKGIGAQILLQAEEDVPIALSLGQTAEIRRILDSLGWKQICPLNIHLFMIRPDRVLKGKFPMGLDKLAAAYVGLKSARRRALQDSRTQDLEVRRIDRFDSTHDVLWRQMSKGANCLAVRDSSYLNWKYIEQPGQHYECWEVRQSNALRGVFVTKMDPPDKVYNYKRNHWVDMVCGMDASTLDLVIRGCISNSVKQGADAISVQLTNKSFEEKLVEHGFIARPNTRYLYASRGLLDACPGLEQRDWLINQGDSDIDRPE